MEIPRMTLRLLYAAALTSVALHVGAQDLVTVEPVGRLAQADVQSYLDLGNFGITTTNGIEYYRVRYTMENLAGATDTVSGLLVTPDSPPRGTTYPTLVSMHGTTDTRFDVPGRADPFGAPDLAYVYGALGYVTVAPDFLNMGSDSTGFHPYVHARTEALAGLRMIEALRSDEAYAGRVNEQLFLAGYSQGGHASMALHEYLIEEPQEGLEVTAAAHMSGPYATLEVITDSVILGERRYLPFGFIP